jgi:shikimate dehydrogenase
MRLKFNADTQLVFQIGDPIEHACAGFLHNAMYDLANVNAVCTLVRLEKGKLPEFIESAKLLGINGFDITTPHKTDIIQYLDECDEASRVFNCVNHVKIRDGKLIGTGLDAVGMGLSIENGAGGPGSLKGQSALILGAGAVAGPIAADLCERGVKTIFVANRTVSKAEYITGRLKDLYGVTIDAGDLEHEYLSSVAQKSDIVVQCTSIGLPGHPGGFPSLEFVKEVPKHGIAADVLYPKTDFLDVCEANGLKTINGMGMLLYQQIAMIDFRFGVKLDESCLSIAEESLVSCIAMRQLRDQRLGKQAG